MGYKVLGFIVWQGGKLYLRNRSRDIARKAAVAGVAGLIVGGAIVAQRQRSPS
jgi:hypothetical protein